MGDFAVERLHAAHVPLRALYLCIHNQPHAGTSYAPEGKVLDASTAAEVAFPADLPCLLQVGFAAI